MFSFFAAMFILPAVIIILAFYLAYGVKEDNHA